jgi:hypothetical protein
MSRLHQSRSPNMHTEDSYNDIERYPQDRRYPHDVIVDTTTSRILPMRRSLPARENIRSPGFVPIGIRQESLVPAEQYPNIRPDEDFRGGRGNWDLPSRWREGGLGKPDGTVVDRLTRLPPVVRRAPVLSGTGGTTRNILDAEPSTKRPSSVPLDVNSNHTDGHFVRFHHMDGLSRPNGRSSYTDGHSNSTDSHSHHADGPSHRNSHSILEQRYTSEQSLEPGELYPFDDYDGTESSTPPSEMSLKSVVVRLWRLFQELPWTATPITSDYIPSEGSRAKYARRKAAIWYPKHQRSPIDLLEGYHYSSPSPHT